MSQHEHMHVSAQMRTANVPRIDANRYEKGAVRYEKELRMWKKHPKTCINWVKEVQ